MSKQGNIDYAQIRSDWLTHCQAEARVWLAHIDRKKAAIRRIEMTGRAAIFERSELLFNIFCFINWLCHIDSCEGKHVDDKKLIPWLQSQTDWPLEIVETFWFCLRNPTMHIGRTSIFTNHDRKRHFGDLIPDLNFDPRRFQPLEYKPNNQQDGWSATRSAAKLEVNYYYPGLRRKLDALLSSVLARVATADRKRLAKLRRVNRNLLPFRVIGGK